MNEHGWAPITLYLWTLNFRLHIISTSHDIFFPSSFDTFSHLKNCKNILTSQAIQIQVVGWIWPEVFHSTLGQGPQGHPPHITPKPSTFWTHSRAPAWALGDPADLGVADGAADPVTPVLLLHHDLALWAVHGLTLL